MFEGINMDEAWIKNLMDRYRKLLPEDPLYDDNLQSVVAALDVVLPQDLKVISDVYDGGTFGAMPNYHLRLTRWGYDVVTVRKKRGHTGLIERKGVWILFVKFPRASAREAEEVETPR